MYAFISVKMLHFEDDIFPSLFLEFIGNVPRKHNDGEQSAYNYLGNKLLIRDLGI